MNIAQVTDGIPATPKKPLTPTTAIEVIGPKEARRIIQMNTHNRTIRQDHLDTMIRDMKEDHWDFNGESIKISKTNVLLDGQHRLLAIIESKAMLPFVVVRGLPDEAQDTVDIGSKRTLGDALHLSGEQNATNLSASVRVSWFLEKYGHKQFGVNPSQRELQEWLRDNPEIRESVKVGNRLAKSALRYTPSAAAALHYRMAFFDPDLADDFWAKLADGTASPEEPVWVLRETLLRDLTEARRMSIWHRIALTIKTWNATRDGRKIKNIHWRSTGRTAESFPTIR